MEQDCGVHFMLVKRRREMTSSGRQEKRNPGVSAARSAASACRYVPLYCTCTIPIINRSVFIFALGKSPAGKLCASPLRRARADLSTPTYKT